MGSVDKLVDSVEAEVYQEGKSEIPSSLIGDLVMEGLKEMDHIAYIRFASIYREFADIGELKQAVDNLASRGIDVSANRLSPLSPGAVNLQGVSQ